MKDSINEVMSILQEECAEVIQAVSKINRFGIENQKLGEIKTNRQHLEEELGDLAAMITLLEMNGVISQLNIEKAKLAKFEKLKKWSNIYENTYN